jgi:hypothetical protein
MIKLNIVTCNEDPDQAKIEELTAADNDEVENNSCRTSSRMTKWTFLAMPETAMEATQMLASPFPTAPLFPIPRSKIMDPSLQSFQ